MTKPNEGNVGRVYNFNWSSAAAASDAIQIRSSLYGTLYVSAAVTATTITFQAATTLGGTFYDVYDPSDNSQVAMDVTTSKCYQIPAAVMTNHFIKCIGQGVSGTGMPSGTTISFVTKE